MQGRIYLDFNASTPIAPEVADAMRPFLERHYGNPSSPHWASVPAKQALDAARAQAAELLGCAPGEIVFTSGGSEASNHGIKGTFFARGGSGHIVTTSIEHPATLNPCRFLERLGAQVSIVGVDKAGRVDPDAVRRALKPETFLVSVMHANNEVGTLQPIRELSAILRPRGILLHCDAAQSVGKLPVRMDELGADLLSVAGHKFYAPKGVGLLYVRNGVKLEPLIHGGGHESGRRAGTENVLLCVGLGAACALAQRVLATAPEQMRILRERLWHGLQARLGARVSLNGHTTERLPNTLNVNFIGRIGAEVLAKLEGVAASTGSACHAGQRELSPVLQAMGVPADHGLGAVRFSIGRGTTEAEIDAVLALVEKHFKD